VLGVSRSGFYDYLYRWHNPKQDDPDQVKLEIRVREVFIKSKYTYGSRRILRQLLSEDYSVGRYRVRSLMRKLNLQARGMKRYKVTTNSKHTYPVVPNLLEREFETSAPNKVWTGDISYIWTDEGWLYLAILMDLYSRQIVGWAMDKHMEVQLVLDALSMAYWRRRPAKGLIHHSDRGIQYACGTYQKKLKAYHMVPSMCRKGDCWDNAPTERFFRSLKSEYLTYCRLPSRAAAKREILEYITFYNADRLHSTLDYVSPIQYENLLKAA
jgi:transposase InsO family protein